MRRVWKTIKASDKKKLPLQTFAPDSKAIRSRQLDKAQPKMSLPPFAAFQAPIWDLQLSSDNDSRQVRRRTQGEPVAAAAAP